MKLTQQQQDEIERSLWIVNTALKKQNLERDKDLRQDAIIHLCKCITRFDPKQGVKWTTYAYKSTYLFIKRTHAKRAIKEDLCDIEDMWEFIGDNGSSQDAKIFIEILKEQCSPLERKVLEYKLDGYYFNEIKRFLALKRTAIKNCKKSITEKAKVLRCKLLGNATNVDATDF